ncbi:MAG: ParB/RepB/Spo0J family partition protein [Oligoflexia bacterium]|nr:ParB/RepB/Spo0J family partition protein [Oligoflexia bacterium]
MPKKVVLGKGLASLIRPTIEHDDIGELVHQDQQPINNLNNNGQVQVQSQVQSQVQVPSPPPLPISSSEKVEFMDGPLMIDLSMISVNKYQPRKVFDEKELEELGNSIKENGLIQPLIVSKVEGGHGQYELIAGERRLRACKMVGMEKIPAIIKRVTDRDKLVMAIIENVQRSDLNCVEEAFAYYQLMEDFNLTQEEVAKKIGKERSTVANFLRILNLPPSVIELLQKDKLTFGHAKVLAAVKDVERVEMLANLAVNKGMSVREFEKLIKDEKGSKDKRGDDSSEKDGLVEREIVEKFELFRREIETKTGLQVNINPKTNDSGMITIKYHNAEEFNQIYEHLLR